MPLEFVTRGDAAKAKSASPATPPPAVPARDEFPLLAPGDICHHWRLGRCEVLEVTPQLRLKSLEPEYTPAEIVTGLSCVFTVQEWAERSQNQ